MWNIIKAQNYQTKNDLIVILSLLFFGVTTIFTPLFIDPSLSFSDLTGSVYAVSSDKSMLLFMIVIVTTRICGWDQSDKTINYEVLVGHSRVTIFFSRIITSFIWTIPVCVIVLFVPLGFCSAINGWGHSADFSWVMIRYLLALLPLCRMICEFAMITFLLKNGGLSTILCFMLVEGIAIADAIIDFGANFSVTWLFGVSNIMALFILEDYSYGYVNGKDVIVYDTALKPSMIIGTVAVSVLVSAACLIIGNVFFKKTDMK